MEPEIYEPRAPGEKVLRINVEISEQIATGCSDAQIRARVLQAFYDYAEHFEHDVVRGPQILGTKRPKYPGDTTTMAAIGIGVQRVR